jgi:hypothetical protein
MESGPYGVEPGVERRAKSDGLIRGVMCGRPFGSDTSDEVGAAHDGTETPVTDGALRRLTTGINLPVFH